MKFNELLFAVTVLIVQQYGTTMSATIGDTYERNITVVTKALYQFIF